MITFDHKATHPNVLGNPYTGLKYQLGPNTFYLQYSVEPMDGLETFGGTRA